MRNLVGGEALQSALLAPCTDDSDFKALLRMYQKMQYSASRLPRLVVM